MAIEILFKPSGVHPQKYALEKNQRVGISVKTPGHP